MEKRKTFRTKRPCSTLLRRGRNVCMCWTVLIWYLQCKVRKSTPRYGCEPLRSGSKPTWLLTLTSPRRHQHTGPQEICLQTQRTAGYRPGYRGTETQTYTHRRWMWKRERQGDKTMHRHARGTYALVFRWLGAKEDAWKKDKLVLQPRTEWRGNQRDFNEAGQSSKVTSVKKSFNRPFHQTLALCACICMEREKEGGRINFYWVMAASDMSVTTDWSSCAVKK